MRQKANKLEKGKWYWDSSCSVLLRFHKIIEPGVAAYDKQIEVDGSGKYYHGDYGILFSLSDIIYIPTPEDIEKYNLNETEK